MRRSSIWRSSTERIENRGASALGRRNAAIGANLARSEERSSIEKTFKANSPRAGRAIYAFRPRARGALAGLKMILCAITRALIRAFLRIFTTKERNENLKGKQ